MKFIKLTQMQGGEPIHVWTDFVASVWPNDRSAKVGMGAGGVLSVRESVEEVLALINGPAPATYNKKEMALLLAGLRMVQHRFAGDQALPPGIDGIVLDAWPREQFKGIAGFIDSLCEKVNG